MKKSTTPGKEFLDKCREQGRIIDDDARIEGIIVALDDMLKVLKVSNTSRNGWQEELIDAIDIMDIMDENDDKVIINFKKTMFGIVGKKRYLIEKSVYQILSKEYDTEEDDGDDNPFWDDAEERARREAAEEEAAEHELERYLRSQEEQDN